MFGFRKNSERKKISSVPAECDETTGTLIVRPQGKWSISRGLADTKTLQKAYADASPKTQFRTLKFDCSGVTEYDSALVCYLLKCISFCREKNIAADLDSLPADIRRLTELASDSANAVLPQQHSKIRQRAKLRKRFIF